MVTTLLAPPVVDDASRRKFLAVLAGAGLLTACGGDGDDGAAADVPTRAVTDSLGRSVTVPVNPRRIVATQAVAGEALLALGAPLVGLETEDVGFYPPLQRDYDMSGVAPIGGFNSINVEQIIALQPDLIIGYTFGGEWIQNVSPETLQEIAPMVALGEDIPRAEYQQMIAELVGRENVLAEQRAEYESKLDEARATLGQDTIEALSVTTLGVGDGEVYVFTRVNPMPYVSVVQDLGIGLSAAADSDELYVLYSLERLADPELQADLVLYQEDSDDPTTLALWSRLPAVIAGQAHQVPVPALTSYRSSIGVLDTLLPLLQAADAATV